MSSQDPTPEWAESCVDRIVTSGNSDQVDALMELLAAIAPTQKEEKYKHEIAWAAIEYAFKQTEHCRKACRKHLGAA